MGAFANFFKMFKRSELTEEFYDSLAALLISSDMGPELSEDIIEDVKALAKKQKINTAEKAKDLLSRVLVEALPVQHIEYSYPLVITVIGVNGVGKTTTIAKLAHYFQKQDKSVLLAAGDTFRAAASSQLTRWAEKLKIKIISQGEGADPASVVYDAVESAKAKKIDVLIVDTAGRLHTKINLMAELKKIDSVIEKKYGEAQRLNFIVLDASIGQNSIAQVRAFKDTVKIDGIILTKLDGTAKGGVAFPILRELDLPIAFLCNGENLGDIDEFDATSFVNNIL